MSRQYTCAWANCEKTDVPIVVTMPMERARFCCMDHAAAGMIRRARLQHPHRSFHDLQLTEIEKSMVQLIGNGK